MGNGSFSVDVSAVRDRARQRMNEGPVTDTYGKDRKRVIDVLNDVVATEVVCWLRYSQHAIAASGINSQQVADEFTEHAEEERKHMLRAAERVSQLGGQPDMDPRSAVGRSHTEYRTYDEEDLTGMLRENLLAERIVITTYQEIIRWLGADDPTTRTMLESILSEEEEHADDLVGLLGEDAASG
ncbi:MAG TPA: ferritin-like domain-containing protein [Streptosporangiaceae bacterium]|nr:ferritin-like domain-containing protein [Streptosporangiaceae bacterium]